MRKILLDGVATLSIDPSYSDSSGKIEPARFLCIVEFVGGLHYDRTTKVWGLAQFKSGHKYIVRRSTSEDAHGKYAEMYSRFNDNKGVADWLIFDFDSKYPDMAMEQCSEQTWGLTSLRCPGGFDFDRKTLRFQYTYGGGYMTQGSAQYEKEHPSLIEKGTDGYKLFIAAAEQPDDAAFSIGKCAPF